MTRCDPRGVWALFTTALLLVLLYLSFPDDVPAADAANPVPPKSAGIDAVLVLDSSGSMKHTDPLNLRLPAAKLFVSLLGKDDRVGLISFSDRGETLAGLTPAHDEAGRQRLFQAVDKVGSAGQFTNLHAALVTAQQLLGADDSGKPRYIIFMSDGKMDTGDAARDAALTAQLQSELIPALGKAHIILYTIAFTQESDVKLLQALADAAHGQFRLAQLDRDLHGVFTSLFESSKTPDMLPIEGGEFHADDAIEEVTVVASKENEHVQIFLQPPDGTRLSAADAGSDAHKELRWFASPAFDMITIGHPAAGDWKVLFTTGQNKAYIVTHLGIGTDLKEGGHEQGETLTVTAWLSREDEVVAQPEILQSTQFLARLQNEDGSASEFMMRDTGQLGDAERGDGIFTAAVPLKAVGQQQLQLIAKSATFERETTRHFKVVVPPPAEKEPPKEQESAAPVKEHAAAQPVSPPVDDSVSVGWLLAGFVLFNLLVGSGIAGGVWWRRRRRVNTESVA